jgi:hypothetical protein
MLKKLLCKWFGHKWQFKSRGCSPIEDYQQCVRCETERPWCYTCDGDKQVCNECHKPGARCKCRKDQLPTPMPCPTCC